VQLRELGGAAPGPAVEATVVLADRYPEPGAPLAAPLEDARPSRLAPERLYDEVMFHQPLWQGVREMELVAPRAARARLAVLSPRGLLRDVPDPELVLDPVVLDAAGQVIGFWAADQLDRGRVVFPFRLAALDLHGPRRPAGEELTCVARIAPEGDALVRSDIEVTGADGRCWMRLTAWEDRRFDVPERFRPLTSPGPLSPLSDRDEAAAAALGRGCVACRRLDARVPDAGLWQDVWARRVLSRRERERFDALALPERRQLEWLGARTAAKEAVAELLRAEHGVDLLPADIEITAADGGAPIVTAVGLDALPAVPVVSLAHAGGRAAALVALVAPGSETTVGIDIEPVDTRPPGFAEAALGEDERRLLSQEGLAGSDEWLLRCWCAKEAAGKAVGSGLGGRPSSIIVTALDRATGRVAVAAGGRSLAVRTLREGDVVVAVTVADQETGGEAR
jgi:phosphopantetheinyl transferase (holo-ACP synthase)